MNESEKMTFSETVEKYTKYEEKELETIDDWEYNMIADSCVDNNTYLLIQEEVGKKIGKKSYMVSMDDVMKCCPDLFNKKRKEVITLMRKEIGQIWNPSNTDIEIQEGFPVKVYSIGIDRAYALIKYKSKFYINELRRIFEDNVIEKRKSQKIKGYIPRVQIKCHNSYIERITHPIGIEGDFNVHEIESTEECQKHLNTIYFKIRIGKVKWKEVAYKLKEMYNIPARLFANHFKITW